MARGDRLLAPFSHPIRGEVMRILYDRVASPKELSDELGERLGNVSYHVKYLARAGCIEIASTAPRRGAVEHYYRPTLPRQAAAAALQALVVETARALNAGSLDAEDERSLTVTTLRLDETGWRELVKRRAAWTEELNRIEAEAAARLADGKRSARRVVVATVGFETPTGSGASGAGAGPAPRSADGSRRGSRSRRRGTA